MSRIAILHPGEMGAAVGRALVDSGHDVTWLRTGRSESTRRRADAAGMRASVDLRDRDVVLSICPPAAAVETARTVASFSGLYVDANAISPGTASEVAAVVHAHGTAYVDGGIIGPPPERPGTTRLFLCGDRAEEVAALFRDTRVEAVVLYGDHTAASALKMTYAAWTKITTALLISARGAAKHYGVDEALAAEWVRSQPELGTRHAAALDAAAHKGWRWEEEMHQIARTFAEAGEPAGFGDAAAQQFGRWPRPASS